MSRERLLTRIDEQLVCGLCHQRMRQPKILSTCSHSFCQSCLEATLAGKLVGTTQLKCPKCRRVTRIPNGVVADLQTNHTLRNMTEIVSETPEGEQEDPEIMCEEHHSVLNQYCSACNELLCSECIHNARHRDHLQSGEVQLVRTILPERVKSLSDLLDPTNDLVSEMEKLMEETETKKRELSSNCQQTVNDIDSFFKEMEKRLDDRRKVLVSAVERDAHSKIAALDKNTEKLKDMTKATVSATGTVQELCQKPGVQVLMEGKTLEQNLQQTHTSFRHLAGQLRDRNLALVLKFQGENSLEQQIGLLGSLTVCETGSDSSYLVVRHQLRVSNDGSVFADAPPPSPTSYKPHYMPLSPLRDIEEPYMYVPMESARMSAAAELARQYPKEYERPIASKQGLKHAPALSGQRLRDSTGPQSGDEEHDSTKRPLSGEVLNLQEASRLVEGSIPSGSDLGSDEGQCVYEPLPPPLPPDHPSRRLSTSSAYEAVVARPANRAKPETIQPVKVISSDQLHEPDSTEDVFPTGICTNSADVITITDLHNHCLRQVDHDGVFIQTFGRQGKSIWHFNSPSAVVSNAKNLYVANRENGLCQRLTLDGEHVSAFGRRHLRNPRGIAISQINGNVYISDSKKQRVYVYRSDGSYVRPIGKHEKNVRFERPVGVAFDTAGNLLVVDRGQVPCILHISQPEGELLGKIGEGYLHYPSDIAVGKNGRIFVSERGKANCISVFAPHGELIRCFGKTGSNPGEFNGPSGVTVNSQGRIIVADQHNHRLQIFDLSEKFAKPTTERELPQVTDDSEHSSQSE